MSFKNKVVLVTGASSGIGAATAYLFAKEGAKIVLVGRNETKMKSVMEKIKKIGHKDYLALIADLAKDDECERIVEETVSKFGKLDILVNNAGFAKKGTILDGKIIEAYDEIMRVNVRAVIKLTTLAAPHIVASKGNIVNVSSVAGVRISSSPSLTAYCISKAALDHFTRCAAKEFSPSGVRVNSVNPGPVITDFVENAELDMTEETLAGMTSLNRVSNSEEIANMITYLAGEKAIGITGSTFVVDNGCLLKR